MGDVRRDWLLVREKGGAEDRVELAPRDTNTMSGTLTIER